MDGDLAPLAGLAALAKRERAWLMVDEAHGLGVLGPQGRGACAAAGLDAKDVPVWMGTLGKALGGAMGGYTTGRKEIIEMLRQRSRPYLFSNSLTPAIVGASIKVIDLLSGSTDLRDRLEKNVDRFRTGIEKLGFKTRGSGAAIVPVRLGDAKLSQVMADKLLEHGKPDAIFAFGPRIAAGAACALRECHLRVPDDIALVCVDDFGMGSELDPFMTIVRQPEREMGRRAAQMLIERILGVYEGEPRELVRQRRSPGWRHDLCRHAAQ